mgnify:CR=1 FL=1
MMTEALRAAVERAAQQSEQEQAAIAAAILDMLDDDATWEALLDDQRTPQLLDQLWAEAEEDVRAGRIEEIKGDGFLS